MTPARADEHIWSALVLASQAEKPKSLPPELVKIGPKMEHVFGCNQFEIIGSATKTIDEDFEHWLVPTQNFWLCVKSKRKAESGYTLDLAVFQDKKCLVETQAKLGPNSPAPHPRADARQGAVGYCATDATVAMRERLDRARIEKLMVAMGAAIPGAGSIYFTGGVSALLFGWRDSTIDADLSADPEPKGFFESLPHIKNQLNVNLELASPKDFLPELPGWRERSRFIARHGRLDFHHFDFYSQALTKLQRSYDRDRVDVAGMFEARLIEPGRLRELFNAIKPRLIRYPKVDPGLFEERLVKTIEAA